MQACTSQFPHAIHLRCCLHFKDNVKSKLERKLKLPRKVAQEFIADILGKASSLEKGFVDADDEETYEIQLKSLKKNMEHKSHKKEPVFFNWFQEYCG